MIFGRNSDTPDAVMVRMNDLRFMGVRRIRHNLQDHRYTRIQMHRTEHLLDMIRTGIHGTQGSTYSLWLFLPGISGIPDHPACRYHLVTEML